MKNIDSRIMDIDQVICKNISVFDASERGLLSQNILSQLRNLLEYIFLKIYSNNADIEISYENICKAITHITTRGDLRFLDKFHQLLQISTSHYTVDSENSERLMLKYYEYLLRVKHLVKQRYNLDILQNIEEFPINTDSTLLEYYSKISEKVNSPSMGKGASSDQYYIKKIKPFFIGQNIYYELTLSIANDKISKFDSIIAFTRLDISQNYAVKLVLRNDTINILNKELPILIITSWEVSIRQCEINNFANIFGEHIKLSRTREINELMAFMTSSKLNLKDIVLLDQEQYQQVRNSIISQAKVAHFFEILDKVRRIVINRKPGSNILRYLLYRMNNVVIKEQIGNESCNLLSNLFLNIGCLPFDQMPYNTSLLGHNPKMIDLFECIDSKNREHEIFARFITNNTERNGRLFTNIDELGSFGDINLLIHKYNSEVYYKHTHRYLEVYYDTVCIKGYVDNTVEIIEKLLELSSGGVGGYTNSVDSWLQSNVYSIDCEEKKSALRVMFEESKVSLIYGSAGTGKSTLINHISHFFSKDLSILYLANTNPAVDNLRRKINAGNSDFKTIAKFLSPRCRDANPGILVIDESSTVSNSDMLKVLNKADFKLLILVGDIFQIEAIQFGNWFNMAKYFIPSTAISELMVPYRSKNEKLLTLWTKVRKLEDSILEHLARNNYSFRLNETIFERTNLDEIVLCLNYDGLYGINNINRFLQSNNPNESIQWGLQTYKIGDPILFNETERFTPLVYNNMKGIILDIRKDENSIQFDIEIDKAINELMIEDYDLQLIGTNPDNGNSRISFIVNKYGSTDEDDESSGDTVVPFQIAYAVSIHKAQGLEYNSVKIVITDEVDELITHNIFYTAITRARDELKIYWTPETEKNVLENMKIKNNGKDFGLLKKRLSPN